MAGRIKKALGGLSRKKEDFSPEDIKTLVKEMVEKGLTEITFRERRRSLTIKRPHGPQDDGGAGEVHHKASKRHADDGKTYKAISSPAVGIIHLSPSSGSTHYVSEGQVLEPGQVVALIETLKVMSEIKADTHGRVVSIEVNNGDMVEFGQAILLYDVIE